MEANNISEGHVCDKVLIVQPTIDKQGHYWLWTPRLASSLAKTGLTITLYTNKSDKKLGFMGYQLIECPYLDSFAPFEERPNSLSYWYGYFKFSFVALNGALKYAKANGIRNIFVTDVEFLTSAVLLLLFGSKLNIVMQVNASNFSYAEYRGSKLKKIYKAFQAHVFGRVADNRLHAITVLGDWHATRLKSQLNLTRVPVYVLPDGCTLEARSNLTVGEKQESLRLEGLDSKVKTFIFAGILRRDKDLSLLTKALAMVASSGHGFNLIFAGSPMEYTETEIKSLIAPIERFDQVNIALKLDYLEQTYLDSLYQISDCVLMPYGSKYNGSAGPLIKGALEFGLPVIVTRVGVLGEIVDRFSLGCVVDADNPKMLANKIETLLDRDSFDEILSAESVIKARQFYSWDNVGERLSNIFKPDLVGGEYL